MATCTWCACIPCQCGASITDSQESFQNLTEELGRSQERIKELEGSNHTFTNDSFSFHRKLRRAEDEAERKASLVICQREVIAGLRKELAEAVADKGRRERLIEDLTKTVELHRKGKK